MLGIVVEVDDDSQGDSEEKLEDVDNLMIEVKGDHTPDSPRLVDLTGSPVMSRPSTASEQRPQDASPANHLAVPWRQTELLDIGIEEVGFLI